MVAIAAAFGVGDKNRESQLLAGSAAPGASNRISLRGRPMPGWG
jgi:hypothetical protein